MKPTREQLRILVQQITSEETTARNNLAQHRVKPVHFHLGPSFTAWRLNGTTWECTQVFPPPHTGRQALEYLEAHHKDAVTALVFTPREHENYVVLPFSSFEELSH